MSLELQRFEWDVLGGDEEFAGEGAISGAAAEGFFGGEASDVGIIVLLGKMCEDEIAGAGIEAFGIGEEFADGVIRKMPGAGQYALLDDPGIGTNFEHIEIVVGFEDEAVAFAKMIADEGG